MFATPGPCSTVQLLAVMNGEELHGLPSMLSWCWSGMLPEGAPDLALYRKFSPLRKFLPQDLEAAVPMQKDWRIPYCCQNEHLYSLIGKDLFALLPVYRYLFPMRMHANRAVCPAGVPRLHDHSQGQWEGAYRNHRNDHWQPDCIHQTLPDHNLFVSRCSSADLTCVILLGKVGC